MAKEYKDYQYLTKAITLPNGKRKYLRAKTKRELDKKVLDFQIAMAQGKVVVSSNMTVRELANLWLEQMKKPSVKPQTYEVYRAVVEMHLVPALGDMMVSDVRQVHIISTLNSSGYNTKSTNKRFLTILRAIFRFGVDNDLISKSPCPERYSVSGASSALEKPLTPNQTAALLDYCKNQKDPNLYLFTTLAVVTGMRRGEIAALRWDCVDFQNSEIQVRRQLIGISGDVTDELKTEAARRDIPIPADVLALLKRARAESSSTYVVGGSVDGHIGAHDIARFGRAWNRAGVTPQNIHAHLFRKTYATRLIETGTDPKRVQYLLGHTTLDMTLQVYAMYDQESQRKFTKELVNSTFGGLVATVAN
jgi:integrase